MIDRDCFNAGFTGLVARYALLATFLIVLVLPSPLRADILSAADKRAGKAAFKALDKDQWKTVRRLTARIKDPTLAKVLRGFELTRPDNGAFFADITGFLAENPDWPRRERLLRRAEEAMSERIPAAVALAWFAENMPVSTDGRIRLGAALLATGKTEQGRALLRDTWINGNFGRAQEKGFFRRYRRLLTRADHWKRLDRLLWDGHNRPVRRMLWRVDADRRALGEARLLLRRREGNVDRAIAKVPAHLRNDPGLVYERLRWRRRKGRFASAMELIADRPADTIHAELWWTERAILARKALNKGHISEAYRVARNHGMEGGRGFAEAEWMAGWIALRFLAENATALDHFVTMLKGVKYPVSVARGAYWAGRAAEAIGGADKARPWYVSAARHPTTYHGQLAAARIYPGNGLRLPADPQPIPEQSAAFEKHELVRVVRILGELGREDYLRTFIVALGEVDRSVGWRMLTASLARRHGRADLAIAVAKKAGRMGRHLISVAYPTVTLRSRARLSGGAALESPLVMAVIRQESAFYPEAKSHAGARGLMQLLPRTARMVAKELKIRYSRKRLTTDPAFNLKLGQTYLAGMIDNYDGSYVLALSAYNAGPTRARQWIKLNGDPRDPTVDVIDWIEMIPIRETRNYVQRILEGLQVYRQRLNHTEVALALERDLRR
jgi:soluble lytic murein transglycosylase